MDSVLLENLSNLEQHVWDDQGSRHTLPARAILARSPQVAELFLKNNAKFVRQHTRVAVPEIPGEPKIWLANMTGNPAAQKELTVAQQDRKTGLTVYFKKPNPLATATTIKYKMGRGQEPARDMDGKETALNLPPIKVVFPPHHREPVSMTYANWLLMMDDQQEDDCRGRLVRCREPQEFEPSLDWSYDDLRLYAQLLDVGIDLKKAHPVKTALKSSQEEAVERLYEALWFYVVDPQYSLPNKTGFEKAKASGIKAVLNEDE